MRDDMATLPIEAPGAIGDERRLYAIATRIINATAALVGLLCLAPLMLLIAALIKLSDPRAPVLYRGARVGKGGTPYMMLKFRTMVPGTEQQVGARLVEQGSHAITPIGRFLRRRKLDELPQLINVLRGEMNLVGPRPTRAVFLDELRQEIPGYDRRFLVPPGITGLAQVRGGYYTDPRNKLSYELLYITHRSLWLDAKLIAATLLILARKALTAFGLLFFILAFVVFVPTTFLPSLHVRLPGGVYVNVAYLLIAALSGGWMIRSILRRGFVLRRTPADRCMLAFVGWAVLGALLNPDVVRNLLGVLYLCSGAFVVYFLATQTVERDIRKVRRYTVRLGLITMVVGLWGVLEYATGGEVRDGELRAASVFGESNVLALFLAMAVPLLLYLRLSSREPGARWFWTAGVAVATVCLGLTFSRSGYLAGATSVLVFLWRWHRRVFYAALVGCALLVVGAELSDHDRLSVRRTAEAPMTARMLKLYGAVVGGAKDELLLGIGWRNWKFALEDTVVAEDVIPLGPVALPRTLKNMYLTILVEHGLIGLFLVLLIFVNVLGPIYEGSRHIADPALQGLLWAIFSSALAFMVNMLFFDSFYFVAVQLSFWLLIGFGVGVAMEFGRALPRRYRVVGFQH